MKIISSTRDILYPDGEWRNKKGPHEKRAEVISYYAAHPEATVTEAARALGVSRPTIYKYKDLAAPEPEKPLSAYDAERLARLRAYMEKYGE